MWPHHGTYHKAVCTGSKGSHGKAQGKGWSRNKGPWHASCSLLTLPRHPPSPPIFYLQLLHSCGQMGICQHQHMRC